MKRFVPYVFVVALLSGITLVVFQNCGSKTGSTDLGSNPPQGAKVTLDAIILNGAGTQIGFGESTCLGGANAAQGKTVQMMLTTNEAVAGFDCRRKETPSGTIDFNVWDCSLGWPLDNGQQSGSFSWVSGFANKKASMQWANVGLGTYQLQVQAKAADGRTSVVASARFTVENCGGTGSTTTTTLNPGSTTTTRQTTTTTRQTTTTTRIGGTTTTRRTTTTTRQTTTTTRQTTTTTQGGGTTTTTQACGGHGQPCCGGGAHTCGTHTVGGTAYQLQCRRADSKCWLCADDFANTCGQYVQCQSANPADNSYYDPQCCTGAGGGTGYKASNCNNACTGGKTCQGDGGGCYDCKNPPATTTTTQATTTTTQACGGYNQPCCGTGHTCRTHTVGGSSYQMQCQRSDNKCYLCADDFANSCGAYTQCQSAINGPNYYDPQCCSNVTGGGFKTNNCNGTCTGTNQKCNPATQQAGCYKCVTCEYTTSNCNNDCLPDETCRAMTGQMAGCYFCRPDVSCFVPGTKIKMADGSDKIIERVKVGDRVVSYDVSARRLTEGAVTHVMNRVSGPVFELVTESGQTTRATTEHPYFVRRKGQEQFSWVKLNNVWPGDEVVVHEAKGPRIVKVQSVRFVSGETQVFNFTVEGQNNYFAEGILVHNKEPQQP